jgi:1-deoxy-D-xylulose-5-phosphate reductoisomerase
VASKKNITILGATGTIGINTLDVIARHPDRFNVLALSANTQVDKLFEQCVQYQPIYAVMADANAAEQLQKKCTQHCLELTVLSGIEGLETIASLDAVDYVMAAIVGAAGLLPNLAAAKAGKRVMLANKESLVMSGQLFMDAIHENQAELLPIDSEHNAIFQCMPVANSDNHAHIHKILLTASGGPFRSWSKQQLVDVTPEQAIAHPNWEMGKKISVDSATMMNKGLEVIEACWLFDVEEKDIQVVIHPQSTIHSMVSYNDGSVLAQLGNPDMRTPIAYALGWPERIVSGVADLDLFDVAQLDFSRPDFNHYPCLRLAYEAHRQGGYATIALNAANEIAVEAFLQRQIAFMDIPTLIETVLQDAPSGTATTLETILHYDQSSRQQANQWLADHKTNGRSLSS